MAGLQLVGEGSSGVLLLNLIFFSSLRIDSFCFNAWLLLVIIIALSACAERCQRRRVILVLSDGVRD